MDPSRYLTREEAARVQGDLELNQLKLTTMLTKLGLQHSREFDEVLDVDDLVQFAQDSNLRLDLAYERYVGERREAKRQRDLDERLKLAKEEGIKEGRASVAAIPYPVPGQGGGENIFSTLQAKPATTVQDIAAELNQLMAENR